MNKEVKEVISYLKENEEVTKIAIRNCNFDLVKIINSDYDELPSHKKREVKDFFAELGLIDKEKYDKEKSEKLRVDDVKSAYYNYDFKEKYMNEHSGYKEETKRVLRVFFRKISELEKDLGKDLYDFDTIEIEQALKKLNAKTVRSIQNTASMFAKYIDYALANNISVWKENFMNPYTYEEKALRVLDKEKSEQLYFSREEIMDMAMGAINAQDGVILALLYDGFSNKNNFEELINLKVSDVDLENGFAKIEGREGEWKVIQLSEETKYLINRAITDEKYLSTKEDSDLVRSYDIPNTIYVLRGLRPKNSETKLSWRNLNQRILRISEYFGEEFLNATNVVVSSQIDSAYNFFMEDKGRGDRAIKMALEKFNYPFNRSALFGLKKKVDTYRKIHIV